MTFKGMHHLRSLPGASINLCHGNCHTVWTQRAITFTEKYQLPNTLKKKSCHISSFINLRKRDCNIQIAIDNYLLHTFDTRKRLWRAWQVECPMTTNNRCCHAQVGDKRYPACLQDKGVGSKPCLEHTSTN